MEKRRESNTSRGQENRDDSAKILFIVSNGNPGGG